MKTYSIIYSIVLAAACAFALSGCAMVLGGGSSQKVRLFSSDGKKHRVSVEESGRRPYEADVPGEIVVRRSSKDIHIVVKDSKDGNIAPTVVASKMNPWLMGNIAGNIPLSFLSSSIDLATGAAWKYDENSTVNTTKESVEISKKRREEERRRQKERREELKNADRQM